MVDFFALLHNLFFPPSNYSLLLLSLDDCGTLPVLFLDLFNQIKSQQICGVVVVVVTEF